LTDWWIGGLEDWKIGRLGEQANSKKEDEKESDFSLHDQE
jgi:hypothetical protein